MPNAHNPNAQKPDAQKPDAQKPDAQNNEAQPTDVAQSIDATIASLRAATQLDVRSLWRWAIGDRSLNQALESGPTWPIAPLDNRNYILWPAGKQVLWLYQRYTIPPNLTGYPLAK